MNTAKKAPQPDFSLSDMRKNAAQAVRLLKSIANESRLMIMCVLSEGECSVGALNKRINLSQSALSQHLAILREEKLVVTRRESQVIHYSLAPTEAMDLIQTLHDIYCVPNNGKEC